jgi:hypothetical protein
MNPGKGAGSDARQRVEYLRTYTSSRHVQPFWEGENQMPASTPTDLAERVARLRASLSYSAEGHDTLSYISATGSVAADQSIGATWPQGWGQGWGQYAGYEGDVE